MSISFSGRELLSIAVGIEERGITFYEALARASKDASTRSTFQGLADMERQHARTFQDMFKDTDEFSLPEGYRQEYNDYFQALVGSAVFDQDFMSKKLASVVKDISSALEIGITAEKDSILFYYEMREIAAKKAQSTIARIISEEKQHLYTLFKLRG